MRNLLFYLSASVHRLSFQEPLRNSRLSRPRDRHHVAIAVRITRPAIVSRTAVILQHHGLTHPPERPPPRVMPALNRIAAGEAPQADGTVTVFWITLTKPRHRDAYPPRNSLNHDVATLATTSHYPPTRLFASPEAPSADVDHSPTQIQIAGTDQ